MEPTDRRMASRVGDARLNTSAAPLLRAEKMRPIHWIVLCALAAMTLVLGAVVVGALSLIWM